MEFNFRTSGTTGEPKTVFVSDEAIEARLAVYREHLPIYEGERVLRVIPGEGRNNFSQVGSVMHPERCGATVDTIIDYRLGQNETYENYDVVFAFYAVFDQFLSLLRRVHTGPRMIVFGGFPFQEKHYQQVSFVFPQAKIISNYGSSEAGVMALTDGGSIKPYCVGRPLIPTKVENGEVFFSGDTLADRYSTGAEIKSQGWFPQGDKAEIIDGELYIYGRA